MTESTRPVARQPKREAWIAWAGVMALVVIVVVLFFAYRDGQASAERDDLFSAACAAQDLSEDQFAECMVQLDETYVGPPDRRRVANAAAQHAADLRSGL